MSPRQVVQKISNGLMILAFLAALWLGWVGKLLHWGAAPIMYENRPLADHPDFHATRLAQLPKKIEAYLQDHQPFRAELINRYAYLKHWCLGLRNDSILIGKDGFLFYDLDGCQSLDYMGQAPFSAEQLDRWKLYLERRQAYLAQRNCRYLFVIAPNMASVYPEKLPDYVAANRGISRREQLLRHLAEHGSPVPVLDLVPPLCDAKRVGQVFFRADSHWNGLGYHFAMQSICGRLHEWFPEVHWNPLGTDYQIQDSGAAAGLWYMVGYAPRTLEPEPYLIRVTPPVCQRTVGVLPANWPPSLPGPCWTPVATTTSGPGHRLLVLGDSYMSAGLNPGEQRPLGDCFQRAIFVANSSAGRFSQAHMESVVYQEAPDVLIEEVAERSIQAVPYDGAIAPEEPSVGPLTMANREKPQAGSTPSQRPR